VSEFTPEIIGEDDGPAHAEGCGVRRVGEGYSDRMKQFGKISKLGAQSAAKVFFRTRLAAGVLKA